jgi:hypothetical protein
MRGAALGFTWSVHVRQLTFGGCKVGIRIIARDVRCESFGRVRTNQSFPTWDRGLGLAVPERHYHI